MNFKRFSLMVLAAALTVGVSTAAPVLFAGYGSAAGGQFLSVTIDSVVIGSNFVFNPTGPLIFSTVEEADGWHTISIDYKSLSGTNGMTLVVNGGWAAYADLQSLDAAGTPIYGLRGDYFTLTGTPIRTVYGEPGPGGYLNYNGSAAPWSPTFTSSSTFEEVLTGKIYFGPDSAPPLDAATPPPSDPPPSDPPPDGTDVPETSGLWLVAAGLPLMLLSKHRSRAVNIH